MCPVQSLLGALNYLLEKCLVDGPLGGMKPFTFKIQDIFIEPNTNNVSRWNVPFFWDTSTGDQVAPVSCNLRSFWNTHWNILMIMTKKFLAFIKISDQILLWTANNKQLFEWSGLTTWSVQLKSKDGMLERLPTHHDAHHCLYWSQKWKIDKLKPLCWLKTS